jgi:uncharacterized protein (TIGR02996 family)
VFSGVFSRRFPSRVAPVKSLKRLLSPGESKRGLVAFFGYDTIAGIVKLPKIELEVRNTGGLVSLSNETAFLAGIEQNPDDRLIRLVYADWLEEQDDELSHKKAQFLRAQEQAIIEIEAKSKKKRYYYDPDKLSQLTSHLPHDWSPLVLHPKLSKRCLAHPKRTPCARRIIKTARDLEAINAAAQAGFWPVVIPVQQNPEIRSWCRVYQDPGTGQISISGDFRYPPSGTLVAEVRFYPHQFECPYAAYLVPRDLPISEEVWLEDLIEDIVGVWGAQGHNYRIDSAPARWNGTQFEILFDPHSDAEMWEG